MFVSSARGQNRGSDGFRGRGRYRGSFSTTFQPPKQRSLSPPRGRLLKSYSLDDLGELVHDVDQESTHIAECRLVASYNWMNRAAPTIRIPGAPPMWTPLASPRTLEEDQGDFFRDQNAARSPRYPFAPAVQTLLSEKSGLNGSPVDIVACGSTIGSLLRLVSKLNQPFCFRVDMIGDTAFFVRQEGSPTELIPNVYGYGHTFPEAYTTWESDVRGSESHQRIIKYKFGGVSCVVRFEADGYFRNKLPKPMQQNFVGQRSDQDSAIEDQLKDLFSVHQPNDNKDITIEQAGREIPCEAIFELKTRTIKKIDQDIIGEELPRLWVRQVPTFILAFHRRGSFQDIRVQDVRDKVRDWEEKNQEILRNLATAMQIIIKTAKAKEDRRIEVRGTKDGMLEIRTIEDEDWSALPSHLALDWCSMVNKSTAGLKSYEQQVGESSHSSSGSDLETDEKEKDYTACSAEDCGYCGRCSY